MAHLETFESLVEGLLQASKRYWAITLYDASGDEALRTIINRYESAKQAKHTELRNFARLLIDQVDKVGV